MTFRRFLRCDLGAELVEMALVLPMLLLLIAGIFDFGFMFRSYEAVTNAAREGARMAILPGYDEGDVQARVQQYLDASGVNGPAATTLEDSSIAATPGGPQFAARTVTVTFTYHYLFLSAIGQLLGSAYTSVPLTAVSTMRAEVAATPAP